MIDAGQVESILNNAIRVGIVQSVKPDNGTVRVTFADKQGLVSGDLPVLVRQTSKTKDWYLPDVGEHVLCLFLPTGTEQGFVLGSFYSEADQPAGDAKVATKRRVDFEDGSFVEFDRETSTLKVNTHGPVEITTTGNVKVTAEGNAEVTAKGTAKLEATGETTVKSGSKVVIDAPLADICGPGGLGVITGASICHFTGSPHADISTKVTAGK